MREIEPRPMAGYSYAVISANVQETRDGSTTDMVQTWLIPMEMTMRDAMTFILGDNNTHPKGRFTLSVPEELPFTPKSNQQNAEPT
jgi:hypothetical protein